MFPLPRIGSKAVDSRLRKAAAIPLILILAILINALLFSIFPLLQRLFSSGIDSAANQRKPLEMVIEYRKPEEKKENPVEQKFRKISNPLSGQRSDPVSFKFTPDLSVEGSGEVVMEQQDLQAVVFEEGETDEAAVPLYKPPIEYPRRARELEIEGVLEMLIVIDMQGKVKNIDIVRSPHSSITTAAKKTVSTWRFKPARNKNIPVQVRVRQIVEFNLD
jgi:protein TonB